MLDVDFYRLHNGLLARDMMPCFCRDFCDFHKSLPCFLPFFAVIFYCPYNQDRKTCASLANLLACFIVVVRGFVKRLIKCLTLR